MEHELKVYPNFYARLADGTKTHEIRYDDRDFQVGDTLKLRCFNPKYMCFTDPMAPLFFKITHIIKGEHWGLRDGFADLSIQAVK